MLVTVEMLVTAVDGLSKPLLRFLALDSSKGASSISKGLPDPSDDRDESSSDCGSPFSTFWTGTLPLYVNDCSDAAKLLVCRCGTKSA